MVVIVVVVGYWWWCGGDIVMVVTAFVRVAIVIVAGVLYLSLCFVMVVVCW